MIGWHADWRSIAEALGLEWEPEICDYVDARIYCCLRAGHDGGHEGYAVDSDE